MAEKEVGIPDAFLHARFVRALPDEYGHVKVELRPGRDHTYGRHAVLYPAPEKEVAAVVPAARASVLLERRQRPE